MLDYIVKHTKAYLEEKSKTDRKLIGQFFTPYETAKYMAQLFSIPTQKVIRILDPGAGSGVLAAALIERILKVKGVEKLELICYENNSSIIPLLESNLSYIKENTKIPLDYKIIEENYITSQGEDFNGLIGAKQRFANYFDCIIGNPPYKKIPKDAPEATSMPLVCHGAPNLYFLFAAMSVYNLNSDGELVYIIPRSWTSGFYFKAFRKYLFTKCKLISVHVFASRDKVFSDETVLQETIIIKLRKQEKKVKKVDITSTTSNADYRNLAKISADYSVIVHGDEKYVFLPTNERELKIVESVCQFSYTLPEIGYKMKTGLTVDFRNQGLLRSNPGEGIIPLFYSQHIQEGMVNFPIKKENEYISSEVTGLMQKNKNYLFVKRFTAKEERRRLQAGIYSAQRLPQYHFISTQNKINFIDSIDGSDIPLKTVYGLYVLFNSSRYDAFYRILNGSTQVNSSEINAMPIPSLDKINEWGNQLLYSGDFSTEGCDKIMEVILMKNVDEVRKILFSIGMPKAQQSDLCCYSLLALAGLAPDSEWTDSTENWLRIHDIIEFTKDKYDVVYAENSRETFRKQAMHHFRTAAVIEDNGKPTNSPHYRYRLTWEMLKLIRSFNTVLWDEELTAFLSKHDKLVTIYASKKEMKKMPVKINGEDFTFSTGKHNQLQKAILEEFAPRFAPGSRCLYVGDTTEKDLVKDVPRLKELGFEITLHDKMPDVVLYREDVDWIYFIESVTSVGPMDPKRVLEIKEMTKGVTSGKIYVTAFLDFKTYKQFALQLAWDTEVWLAELPEHMIHLNGDRFMGPRD